MTGLRNVIDGLQRLFDLLYIGPSPPPSCVFAHAFLCDASDISFIFVFEPYAEEDLNSDTSCFHFISLAKHLLFSVFWNVLNFLAAPRVFAVLLSG